VKTALNILWLVLAGVWLAISYVFAAVLLTLTIIGIPFAKQALKLAGYALWPFGRTLVQSATRHKGISVVGNVLWFVLAGWWLAHDHRHPSRRRKLQDGRGGARPVRPSSRQARRARTAASRRDRHRRVVPGWRATVRQSGVARPSAS
jgi:Inner membrane component domain